MVSQSYRYEYGYMWRWSDVDGIVYFESILMLRRYDGGARTVWQGNMWIR